MSNEYLVPFVDSTVEMISTMVGIPCEHGGEADRLQEDYVSGSMYLSGSFEGQIKLSFSFEIASKIVAEMLAMEVSEIDEEMICDGVGEMVNIVAGAAKTRLVDSAFHFELSLPSITVGKLHNVKLYGSEEQEACRIHTELGDFNLFLYVIPPEDQKDK
ncbi:MAG: chemotaxis protein CheX [Myxococcota bacterium]|nr:chemotaxis protein CheX [Myxococcota bacterium]